MIITIDGAAGTGKSTVAKGVAKKLGFTFFDTGAMYRSLAWLVLQENIDPADEAKITALLPQFQFEIKPTPNGDRHYFVQGHDVTRAIRTPEISAASSQIAIYPAVRQAMVAIQRRFGQSVDAVFEGRDMGTIVFPDADLKIFLTASPDIRAERRYRELLEKFPDLATTQEEIRKEIAKRDLNDTTRAVSPLKQASDAILIDTSHLTIHEVIDKITRLKPKRHFPRMGLFYRFIYLLARLFFKVCFRLRIYGLEHFRPGAAILAANHTSYFDPPVLSISCPEEVHFLARASLFDIPLLGRLIRRLNTHPVARDATDTQTLKMLIDLLTDGKKLILFPEGKRSPHDELLPLEKGIAFLAHKTRCRIIPAYIEGAHAAWPSGRKFPRLFGKITVVFGSSLELEEELNKKEAQTQLLKRTENAIRHLKSWLRSSAHGSPP
jgi:cytidylate kinase